MPTLFLIVFVDLVGFGLVIPLLPFYALRFGASPLQVTLLFAVYSLMQIVRRAALGPAQRPDRPAAGADGEHGGLGRWPISGSAPPTRCGCCSPRARSPAPAPATSPRRRPISPM